MTKHLFICRHAEASAPISGQPDETRKLTSTGVQEAIAAGNWIKKFGINIEFIGCSSATRTLETAYIMASQLGVTEALITPEKKLYNVSAAHLKPYLNNLDNQFSTAVLVAHNPGVPDLTSVLNPEFYDYLPTAGICYFEYNAADWQEVEISQFKFYRNF